MLLEDDSREERGLEAMRCVPVLTTPRKLRNVSPPTSVL